MLNFKSFIGIDISKATLDYCFFQDGKALLTAQVVNRQQGFKALEKHAKTHKLSLHEAVFCFEHTGIYTHRLLGWLNQRHYQVWLENPLAIKRSLGLQRGKNDRVDAQRIAAYAYRFKDKCQLWQPPRPVLEELQRLASLRRRLLNTEGILKRPLKESKGLLSGGSYKNINESSAAALKGIGESLKDVDKKIEALIKEDSNLARLFSLATSVPGVGSVTAVKLIIETNEFKKFGSCKKLASHAGVVPFEHRSGSSVRGRTRLSPLANKELKKLLHMGAIAAIKTKEGELGKYYEKKVGEGKPTMSVINAVRNKVLNRVYASIRDNKKYESDYKREKRYAN